MKVKFYGAAGEVGRSCIMIESKGTKVLLDAGVKLGSEDAYPMIKDDELKTVDAVLLSHAHLDHCGYIPHMFTSGWKGKVYSLKPTFELVNVLISDYMRISSPENISKEGVNRMQKGFNMVEYHKEFKLGSLKIKFLPAGHILGSAMIHINDGEKQLIYTGDINVRETKILDAAYTEHLHADALITESTYAGDADVFPSERTISSEMAKSIKETINAGGKVIVPSFAVGRAEEVLLLLDDYMHSGVIPKTKIYIDGMIGKAMRIHRHNVIYCRDELQKRILMSEDDPFKSNNFYNVITKQLRSKLMSSDESCIIVTTSGMLTGGPVLKYIEKLARFSVNKMVLVGYQAEGTRGRDLQDGKKEILINDLKIAINMKVEMYHLSAHADRPQLMTLISKIQGLKHIFIVHGESEKSQQFYDALKNNYNTYLPKLLEEFEI
jgi:predicted metal-dependent RNase